MYTALLIMNKCKLVIVEALSTLGSTGVIM